jgi:hypothetical protein
MPALRVTARLPGSTAGLPAWRAGPSRVTSPNLAPARRARASTPTAPPPRAQGKDFDAILADFAEDFEKMDTNKKVAVLGWGTAALGAVALGEKLMHSVVLDVLLGGPIQLLGLLALPGIVLKAIDGKDLVAEAGEYVSSIAKRLPGLDK